VEEAVKLHLVPVAFETACSMVAMWHRHNVPPVGHKYSVGVADESGVLLGVAIVGRPVARSFDDGGTLEVTQADESGASLRAAGYRVVASRPPRPGWSCPSRPREDRGVDGIARTLWEVAP
jgi:hypothetical protein